MANGKQIYTTNCQACHQANGQGMPPAIKALAGSKKVTGNIDCPISILLNGIQGSAMQSFAEQLSDEEIAAVSNNDLRNWLQDFIAVEIVTEEMIEEIIRSEIEMYNYRSYEEIDLLEFMGRACPAFGMIGTVVGLILMLGSTTSGGADIAGVMGGMSVALITTLYGVLLAQIIFLPIASKRYKIKETQVLLMEMMREGLLYLKRRELPETAAKDLIIYLPPKLRKKILLEEQAAMNQDLGL